MNKEEILDFIERRFSTDCNWTDGNCLYFALILKYRFPKLRIWYLPIEGHFITGARGTYYDWTGEIFPDELPILLEDIEKNDPDWFHHLIRDCFM